jgi:dTDP-4-amino-4,6-dideoxygalactose transaminase
LSEKIPLYKPQNVVGEEVLDEIRKVLESGWLTMGSKTEEFERIFADYIGCKYGVANHSCTSALFLALDALGIKKGDQVVVPVMTFAATANVVRWVRAEPIFCDVAEDGEIDVAKLENLLETNDKIKCVIPVHLYGFPCDMRKISRLVKEYGVKMVEDCAQSHGATVDDKKVGSFGDAGCFSFYATKNITTGEGGMLVTDNKEVRDRAFLVRSHCQTKTPKEKVADWWYDIIDLGFNFRMSEIEAVIGIKQMEKIDFMIKSRREIAKMYKEELERINGIEMLHDPESSSPRQGVYHLLVVKVEKEYPLSRDKLYLFLQENGIITGVHYPPLHYFSYYKETTNYEKGDFPCAEELFSKILSLPMFPYMKEHEFRKIIRVIKKGAST